MPEGVDGLTLVGAELPLALVELDRACEQLRGELLVVVADQPRQRRTLGARGGAVAREQVALRVQRALADDLVFNRRPDALQRFIEGFSSAAELAARSEKEDPTASMSPGGARGSPS